MNREELLQKLEPAMNMRIRAVDHALGTRVVATAERVAIRPSQSGRYMEFAEDGVKNLANFIGIGWPLAQKLTGDTFGKVATELMQKQHQYALVLKDDTVTGVIKGGSHVVDTNRALATIERVIPNVDFHRATVEGTNVELEVVGLQQATVTRGDLIRAGALVRFSPVGNTIPEVQSYALRLACTNGATSNTVMSRFQFGGGGGADGGGNGGDNFWNWLRKSVHDAYGALNQIAETYQRMRNERIPANQRAAVLEGLLRQAHISGGDADTIRAMALQDPPSNAYDMFNLITYATSHILQRPAAIRKANEVVATFSSEEAHEAVCPMCHGHSRRPSTGPGQVIDSPPVTSTQNPQAS